jgi:hypothetical protein
VRDNSGWYRINVSEPTLSNPLIVLNDKDIVFTAVDKSGNTNTCTIHIRLVDRTPPTLSCPFEPIEVRTHSGDRRKTITQNYPHIDVKDDVTKLLAPPVFK